MHRKLCLLVAIFAGLATATVTSNKVTVTTSGTAVQLASSGSCTALLIRANSGNTGKIWIGGSTISASSQNGAWLNPSDPLGWISPGGTLRYYKLTDFWIDATNSGDGVTWTCIQ